MRIKNITLFISDSGLKQLLEGKGEGTNSALEFCFTEFARFKHPASIKVPYELTTEITESQFDEAFKFAEANSKTHALSSKIECLKQKLFESEKA